MDNITDTALLVVAGGALEHFFGLFGKVLSWAKRLLNR
jgi:hypothetical protein